MRAAVIGARGFVGAAVVEELARRGYHVVALDRQPAPPSHAAGGSVEHRSVDILDRDAIAPLLHGADEVYHFAARLGTSELEEDLRGSIHTNILGALNVFEAAVKAGVPRVFYASKPSVWLNVYTLTKHTGEQIARLLTRYNPVQICVLRYLNIYGPGQKLFSARKILPVFAAQALRRLPIQVYGDGQQTMDMVYSRDVARLTVDYLGTGYCEAPCDCGTGREMTAIEVAEAVNAWFDSPAGVEHIPMRKGETPRTRLVADTGPLRSVLGGRLEFTPWETALDASLRWYADRPPHEIDAALAYHGIHQRYGVSWST